MAYAPGDTSRLWTRPAAPVPSTLPPLVLQENVSGALSGSLATAVISTGSPTVTLLRSAEQLIVGGRFGRGATRTFTEQFAVPLRRFSKRKEIVYVPGWRSAELHRTFGPLPSKLPSLADHE